MNRGVKIGLIAGVVIALAVGGYFIYKKLTSDGTDSNDDSVDDQKPQDLAQPQSVSSGGSYDPTPFKNKGQSDYFRLWVNRYYPKDAKALDLSKTGEKDNSFIRKAWMKYGVIYKQNVKNWDKIKNAVPSSFAEKFDKKESYNFAISSDGIIKLTPKRKLSVESLFFGSDGNWHGGAESGKWWNGGKEANVLVKNKSTNVKGDNFFKLAKAIDDKLSKSSFTSFTHRNGLDLENNFVD